MLDCWFDSIRTVIYIGSSLISCMAELHPLWFSSTVFLPLMCGWNIFFAVILVGFDRWSILIKKICLIKSSQGPSFLPSGKGSQMAKKNLSNIVAAKTIKVQSVLLVLHAIFSVLSTVFISSWSVVLPNPWFVCLQAGIIVSYGFEVQRGCTVCFSAMIRALT